MAASDEVPFYLNEQFSSADQNTQQSLGARWLTDALRYVMTKPTTRLPADAPIGDTQPNVVLGGLTVTPSGASVSIAAGALLVTDQLPTTPDVDPTTGDTLAFHPATEVIAAPVPGVDTWYVLEAQPQDVDDPTVSRRVWDEGAAAWVDTPLVKRRRRTIAFRFTDAGAPTEIPGASATWVAIAGVFRPSAGGVIANEHLVDLRPLAQRIPTQLLGAERVEFHELNWRTSPASINQAATEIAFKVLALNQLGEFSGATSSPIDPLNAAYVNPADAAPVADEWWYLYLCPWRFTGLPRHGQADIIGQGVFVFSKVAATQDRKNSASLTLPAPFGVSTAAAGTAVCFGAIQRNAGNTAWRGATCVEGRVRMADGIAVSALVPFTVFGAIGGTSPLPANAVSFDASVYQIVVGANDVLLALQDPTGLVQASPVVPLKQATLNSWVRMPGNDLRLGQAYDLSAVSGVPGGVTIAEVVGYEI